MRLADIQLDDILQSWHDTGAMGAAPVYYRVLKKAKVKIRVRCEYGDEGWMYPEAFTKRMIPSEVDWLVWK